ncbi:hypothetical protein THAOC_07294 [Thalassiosira oceanica]|uniref:Uncharacterized protein n=1 Tax=Thalassiosira oceanica TaxID=159749 RepID=K0TCT8_THAOC|nr:hypothetical protein THAOC_07294 [Thalassiosira oceanica]|eukprot:EJK71286.1 hypothetical protein THAOC_07294 [Thalassiosira oceanica]
MSSGSSATDGVAVLAISKASTSRVNALAAAVRVHLKESILSALEDPSINAIILVGNPDGTGMFSAGADIKEFSAPTDGSGGVTTAQNGVPTLNDLGHMIEGSSKPIVAALSGVALGGGMELALASHYRVADRTLRYGLPEVKIGLIPGAGGTQRLPRLCGVRHALDVILRGRINVGAEEGLKVGFLDAVASDGETVLECAQRWARWASVLSPQALGSRRLCNRSVPEDTDGIGNSDMCEFALQKLPREDKGGESAHACLKAVRASFELPSFTEGMEAEKDLFIDLLYHSLQGRAYRHIFFAERSSSSGSKTAATGYTVILSDINQKGLEAGVKYIRGVLQGDAKKGRLKESKLKTALSSLKSSTDLSSLADCDIIVEAVFENLKVKRDIFSRLDGIVRSKEALLLSNTSTLNVDTIASSLSPQRRAYCCGMHFFSPAHLMKLVEIIRGESTSPETLDIVRAVTKRIRKVPVVVGNCDGFVGNRMLHPYSTESVLLLSEYGGGSEGVGIADIDSALLRFGMAVGPFAMYDIAGNDIGYTELGDEMVEKLGRLGQKVYKGWYDYDPKVGKGRKPLPSPEMQSLIDKYVKDSPNRGTKMPGEEIVYRVLLPLVNEAFKILEEGIALDPSDVDVIYLYGYGFPAYRGGPLFWADNDVGLRLVLDKLEEYFKMHPNSEYFRPSNLLKECVGLGMTVQEYYRSGRANLKSKL